MKRFPTISALATRFLAVGLRGTLLTGTALAQSGSPGLAQEPKYIIIPNTTAIVLMPELKNATAPAWVKPGLRLVFAGVDGILPGTGQVLVPTNDGRFKDQNGQLVQPEKFFSGAGGGMTQADIVAVHDDAVVLEIKSSIFNGVAGILSVAGENGLATTPGAASGGWIHPDVLRKHLDVNAEHVTTSRIPYKAAGKTYNAIWVQIRTDNSATATVYDIDSGLLLHTSNCVVTATTNTVDRNGVPVVGGGQTYLSNSTLAEIREVKAPWTQGRLPKAIEGVHRLSYDGQTTIQAQDGLPHPPIGLQMTLAITGRGVDFVQMHKTLVDIIGGARTPHETDVVSGPAQLMPLAIDPADLAKLKVGQELDNDPVTKAVVKVTFAGRDSRGQDVVILTEAIPGNNQQQTEFAYDRATGLVVSMAQTNPYLHLVSQLSLTTKE